MEIKKNEDRLEWIELLRFISIVCVVMIHSMGGFINTEHGSGNWWFFNVLNSFIHFCVPVFVMISGALLLKREISLSLFLKKRFTRILFPFLFWSIILFVGNIFLRRPLSESSIVVSFFSDLFYGKINSVYWFVYMLIGLYLIAPILTKWIISSKIIEIEYFLLIWLFTLFITVFPFFNMSVNLSYFSGFIGYFILGYYLTNKKIDRIISLRLSVLLIIAGGSITIIGNYFFKDRLVEDYLTPNIMILSVGMFLFIKNFTMPKVLMNNKVILKISKYSFGIYLIHVLFISILDRIFGINCLFISPYLGTFIVTIIVLLCSVVFLEIFKLLPFTKYISGI